MNLTGNLLIGAQEVPASAGSMKALNPATNQEIEPSFAFGGRAEVDRAARLADDAFDSYTHTTLAERAAFLERARNLRDSAGYGSVACRFGPMKAPRSDTRRIGGCCPHRGR
jgi:alpha-ketoglutaric semialdehyde dehydrogenase